MRKSNSRHLILDATINVVHLVPEACRGSAPLIVFLHEGLGSLSQWKGFPEALCAAASCQGLAYERHGHGASGRAERRSDLGFFVEEAVEILPSLLHEHPGKPVVLFGHSDGATIALQYASLFPEKVSGVVAMAPHVLVEDLTIAGIRLAGERFHGGDLRERLARYHGENTDAMFASYRDRWLRPDSACWNMFDALASVTAPLLLIQGERDEYGTGRQLEEIARRVSGPVTTRILRGCGHMPHIHARDSVLRATTEFLAEVSP